MCQAVLSSVKVAGREGRRDSAPETEGKEVEAHCEGQGGRGVGCRVPPTYREGVRNSTEYLSF